VRKRKKVLVCLSLRYSTRSTRVKFDRHV
jgi:hypothetical protein